MKNNSFVEKLHDLEFNFYAGESQYSARVYQDFRQRHKPPQDLVIQALKGLLEREGKQTIIETDSCKIRNIYSEINPAKFIILKQKLNIPDSLNFIPIDRKDY